MNENVAKLRQALALMVDARNAVDYPSRYGDSVYENLGELAIDLRRLIVAIEGFSESVWIQDTNKETT